MFITDLFEAKKQGRTVVIYGGGFQPFHAGHLAGLQQAHAAFPNAEFYIATSNDTKKRPIPFAEKKFLIQQAGVADPVVQVANPINPKEILQNFDPEKDTVILIRSAKEDLSKTVGGTKADKVTPKYWQHLTKGKLKPFGQQGYVFVSDFVPFTLLGQEVAGGTDVREMYASADDATRLKIAQELYPAATDLEAVKAKLDQYLAPQLAECSGYIPKNSKEAKDPRWSNALTVDVTTKTPEENLKKLGLAEHIVKVGNKYRLVSKHGHKNLGTYDTKAGAEKRERQVQYFKHAGESVDLNEFAPDEGGESRKFIPWTEFIEQLKQILQKDFSCKENIVKSTIKARFVPHDPMEFGPTMLYSYYEARAGRNKGAISTRGSIQVGKYTKGGLFGQNPDQLLTGFHLLKGHPFERHFDLTFDNIYKIANIIQGNTQGALEFQPQPIAEDHAVEPTLPELLADFLPIAMKQLQLTKLPKITLDKHVESHSGQSTFGRFLNDDVTIQLAIANRHPVDILRTLAHELVHFKQLINDELDANSGNTGSNEENEANAVAGVIMRDFNLKYPNAVNLKPLEM